MCIVVDINNISRVFNPNNSEHAEFIPVHDWIFTGNGKLVVGGSTFEAEMRNITWFLNVVSNLSRLNKVYRADTKEVDDLEQKIKDETPKGVDFDDPHLVSLLAVSQCKLICSDDSRAYPHFKTNIHLKGNRPKIYTGQRNKNLLKEIHICDNCRPNVKLKKEQIRIFDAIKSSLKK